MTTPKDEYMEEAKKSVYERASTLGGVRKACGEDNVCVLSDAFEVIASLLEERDRLREFADYVLQYGSWQGCDIDGGDAQDKAIALDLVELRPIPEEDSIDGEKEHYFTKWTAKESK